MEAKWISIEYRRVENGVNPWEHQSTADYRKAPLKNGGGLPIFRKEFTVSKEIKDAVVKATALGIFELYINGKKVGKDVLKPGWTEYRKRVLYYEYDVKEYLTEGVNCITGVVSPGWWQGRINIDTYPKDNVAFLARLDFTYADGTTSHVSTDEDWKCKVGGAVLNADIWDGEFYDARIDNDAFKYPGFDDSDWNNALIYTNFKGEVSKHIGPAIREREFLNMLPVSMKLYEGIRDNGTDYGEVVYVNEFEIGQEVTIRKGQTLLIDFGQNLVGWPRFTVKGKRGTSLLVRFAEMLNDSGDKSRGNDGPKGSLYTENYRSAKSRIQYILRGDEFGETYNPTHTFFGFRYTEITADDDIGILFIKACVVGSDPKETGRIRTSSEDVNKLISNVIWGQRGNYLSIPTDCPQRDERLGWTGDTQIFVNAACYNADVREFFHKWMQDMRDCQSENGAFPDVAPRVRVVGEGNAAWADAGVIVPYVIYRMYGDKKIIEDNFEAMDRYIQYLRSFGLGGGNAVYGDWLSYEPTDKEYISCCMFALSTMYMRDMARAIGSEKEVEYAKLYEDIKKHFQDKFLDENGKLKETSQTAYLLALKTRMLPESYVQEAADCLEQKIKDNGYRLSTGFIGTGILNQTLSEFGKSNIAYSLLLQTEDPSWLYSVYQGATTIWERWNSYTIEKGFGDAGMNSFNHYAYGAVLEWMYKYMAGINNDFDEPGFKHVVLRPMPDTRTKDELTEGQENITFVEAEYESASGLIKSSWRMENGTFVYNCTVPTRASLFFPLINKDENSTIRINDKVVPVSEFERDGNRIRINLNEPGSYTIE